MPYPFTTTADVCDREAAFLNLTNDGLPVLLASAGGKWDVVQAYIPRTPARLQKTIWVTRPDFFIARTAEQRSMPTYAIELRLRWPVTATSSGDMEDEQRAFDAAIHDVVFRVLGTPPSFQNGIGMDKTHDGQFLSAAENPGHVQVRVTPADDAWKTTPVVYTAFITYAVDDYDFNN